MKSSFLIIVFGFLLQSGLIAQQASSTESQQKTPQQATEPVDLPTIFVKGQLLLNVNSGTKQEPEKPVRLSMDQLDSLNSLEKQQSLPVPIEALPFGIMQTEYKKGYLNADIGSYAIGNLNAGYGFNIEGYELYANAGLEFSDGHVKNSEYTKLFARLSSDYIAPQKFFIFGGSRTRTEIEYKNKSYKLYSSETPSDRQVHNIDANIDVDGNYSGIRFQTGFGFEALQSITSNKAASNNNFLGYVKLHKLWNNFMLAGNLLLDFNYLKDNAANFIQIDGSGEWIEDNISINLNGGFQLAGNSKNIDRGGLLISGEIEYQIDKMFTLKAKALSGLENKNWTALFKENPYLSNTSEIDFAYNIASVQAFLYIHPSDKLGLSIGGKFRITDRLPIFSNSISNTSTFDILYESANISKGIIEAYWNITALDKIIANFTTNSASLTDKNSNFVPYMPMNEMSIDYNRIWINNIGTTFGIDFIGERYGDLDNDILLDSYINVRMKFDYRLNEKFSIYANFDNLLNQEIVLFNGYKERGLFLNIGLMLQF